MPHFANGGRISDTQEIEKNVNLTKDGCIKMWHIYTMEYTNID